MNEPTPTNPGDPAVATKEDSDLENMIFGSDTTESTTSSGDDLLLNDFLSDGDFSDDDFLLVAMVLEAEEGVVVRRTPRVHLHHDQALACINRDYLNKLPLVPVFDGKEFDTMFRISKARFMRLMKDFALHSSSYYKHGSVDAFGRECASFEAKLLLPLKVLAYGVAPHAFRDYFQMSSSNAARCCKKFNQTMIEIYQSEYLRLPTPNDVKAITGLHEVKHGVPGMIGSLDCMHTYWKNCPTAWQGSFCGAKKKPTIVLEASCDYHLFFWHCSYGYSGSLNDINILNQSHLQRGLIDGTFAEIERRSGTVPFSIGGDQFSKLFFLVDGIYPRYSRFVKAVKQPITAEEKQFTLFQELARKDIERAFGVLQVKFKAVANPIHFFDMSEISNMVSACLILHNQCVSDRVMNGDVFATYDPLNSLQAPPLTSTIAQPANSNSCPSREPEPSVVPPSQVIAKILEGNRWDDLTNGIEYRRLLYAFLRHFEVD